MIEFSFSSRRPLFWIILSGILIGGTAFSFKYFAKAFPIINLDISMDRKEALHAAEQLAQKYNWGPKGFEQTASFSTDETTKNFIELEGGGKEVLNTIIKEKYYAPYTWNVRHFKEHETNEIIIKFTPEGTPYGFSEKIPENVPGAALSTDQARSIALKAATQDWNIDFSQYKLVESSQETKLSGRIDHTFVYELLGKKVGEAPYHLQLEVSGDRLTELSILIKVPEAFLRRYEHMRSANNLIAQIASTLAFFLYFFGGCLIGLFFLARRRWVIWSSPFLWSSFIGLLSVLNSISQFPLLWMNYDTALAKSTLYIKYAIGLLTIFSMTTIGFGLIFAAAEGLTRMAFDHQPQLWKLWSRQAAASIQTLGRTLGGYLIIGWDFAFVIAVYLFASRFLGWWTPSSELIDPNILATYFPWINAIAQSLSAGFWEECFFRAIPLSCAALIGKKRGNRTAWITAAFILQALIFSAAHANYPSQPSYARFIELLIPSSIFGGIYLTFGLLPSIISHFVFDVIWIALPIFLSDILINKVLVVLLTLIPLLIILGMRLKAGQWFELPKALYNAAWQSPTTQPISPSPEIKPTFIAPKTYAQKYIIIAGILGIIGWLFATHFTQDGLPLAKRSLAQGEATKALAQKNIVLEAPWKRFSTAVTLIDNQHRFIWKINTSLYRSLLHQNYLYSPHWKIRYAQFEGDIINRAEEYAVFLNPLTHSPIRIVHQLPESQPGKILLESDARVIAQNVLKTNYAYLLESLHEISAISTKQPDRLDWIFTYSDSTAFPTTEKKELQGQARVAVKIAGDQVVDHYQYVFVPEDWLRIDRQEQTIFQMLKSICFIFLAIILIMTGIQAIIAWVHQRYAYRIFLFFFIVLFGISCINTLNFWPTLMGSLKTSEPISSQLFIVLSTFAISFVVYSGASALLAGFMQRASFFIQPTKDSFKNRLLLGISWGSIFVGSSAIAERLLPSVKPLWADYGSASAFIPSLSIILNYLTTYISMTVVLYIVIKTIDTITHGGTMRKIPGIFLCIFFGIILKGVSTLDNLWLWLISGIVYGILLALFYATTLRFNRTIIPLTTGTILIAQLIQQAVFNAFSGALLGILLSIPLVMIATLWWSNTLETHQSSPQSIE